MFGMLVKTKIEKRQTTKPRKLGKIYINEKIRNDEK